MKLQWLQGFFIALKPCLALFLALLSLKHPISYLKSGEVEDIVTHTVHSGTMVEAPVGYHPTVASPGTRNSYLWVLAAHSHSSRSYNLAVLDPALENFNSAR